MHRYPTVIVLLALFLMPGFHSQRLKQEQSGGNLVTSSSSKIGINPNILIVQTKSILVRLSKVKSTSTKELSVANGLQADKLALTAKSINKKANQVSFMVQALLKLAAAAGEESKKLKEGKRQNKPKPGEILDEPQKPTSISTKIVKPTFIQLPGEIGGGGGAAGNFQKNLAATTAKATATVTATATASASATATVAGAVIVGSNTSDGNSKIKDNNEKQSLFSKISEINSDLKKAATATSILEKEVQTLANLLTLRKDGTCDGAGRIPLHGSTGNCKTTTMAKGKACQPSCIQGATASGARSCSNDGKSILTDTFKCTPNPCPKWSWDELMKVLPDNTKNPNVDQDGTGGGGDCKKGIAHGAICHPKCRETFTPIGEWTCQYGKWKTKHFICEPPTCDGSSSLSIHGRNKRKIFTHKWVEIPMTPCSSEMKSGSVCKQEAGTTNLCIDGYEAQGRRECGVAGELIHDDLRCM